MAHESRGGTIGRSTDRSCTDLSEERLTSLLHRKGQSSRIARATLAGGWGSFN